MDWLPGRGLSFDCPKCRRHRVVVRFREEGMDGFARLGDTFETLTLLPEIHLPAEIHDYPLCRTGTHWRGWVHNGRVRSF